MSDAALDTALQGFVWRPAGPPRCAADPVSEPVIRQWAEVLGDRNPVYVDAEAAVATGRPGVVAPPTMLQVWTMAGYRATVEQTRYEGAWGELLGLLREHGFDAIVATDCEQDYHEEIEPGRRLIQADEISAVSERKGTALGEGYFVTLTQRYRDAETDVLVGTALFRMLVYRPHEPGARGAVAERPLRPRPAITPDSAWWEGVRANELLIQRCVGCGRLRHPPGPACPACRSLSWDTVTARGTGSIYSFTVSHHPQMPAFDYPLAIGLLALDEGVRVVGGIVGVRPEDIRIGQRVAVEFFSPDPDLRLPRFRVLAEEADHR
jgi:uncharacterized OB-fold protein